MKRCARFFLMVGLLAGLLLGVARPAQAAPGDVTVTDNGTTVTLANDLVSIKITKATAEIDGWQYNGLSLLAGGYDGGKFYWTWNMPNLQSPSACTYTLTADPATTGHDYAEIKLHQPWSGAADKAAMDVDIYYCLRRGAAGVYAAAKLSHPASYPFKPGGEWRMAAYPGATFDWLSVDAARNRLMPSLADERAAVPVPGAPKEVMRLTTGPYQNYYECKYDYSADFGALNTWGWSSTTQNVGLWMTAASKEYYPGGPLKRELMGHASPVLLNMLGGTHYGMGGSGDVAADEAWQKIYGPFLIYCNKVPAGTANAPLALWHDAQQQVLAEQAQWPYPWFTEPAYVLAAGRGTVTGQLVVADAGAATAAGAGWWVGLAVPPDTASAAGDFQLWTKNYQFWTQADAAGNFTLPHVLPGTYTLFAFGAGTAGQLTRKLAATVVAGGTTALGQVTFTPPRVAPTVWEIGVPDRSAAEFRHGDDYWVGNSYPNLRWAKFLNYATDFPQGVRYTVSQSSYATDWNYVQPYNELDSTQTAAPTWQVSFALSAAPPAGTTASVYVALAANYSAALIMQVNGTTITPATTGVYPGYHSDATVRLANHGAFADLRVSFPASLLRAGANALTITQRKAGGDVQYDYLRLEAPGTRAVPLPVTLVGFSATARGPAAVSLAWTTASEVNSARFEVERSLDGTAFAAIGQVAAAGSAASPRQYTLLDAALPPGAAILYYRLRQVDLNGPSTYSPVRSVAVGAAEAGPRLYPNPARTSAALTGASPGSCVQVLDALGRPVATATATADGTAQLALPPGLAAGVYLVRAGCQVLRLALE